MSQWLKKTAGYHTKFCHSQTKLLIRMYRSPPPQNQKTNQSSNISYSTENNSKKNKLRTKSKCKTTKYKHITQHANSKFGVRWFGDVTFIPISKVVNIPIKDLLVRRSLLSIIMSYIAIGYICLGGGALQSHINVDKILIHTTMFG